MTEPVNEYVPPFLSSPGAKWTISFCAFVQQGVAPMHLFANDSVGERIFAVLGLVLTALALFAHAKALPAAAAGAPPR